MKRIIAIGVLLLCLTTLPVARAAEDRNAQIKAEMVQNYLLWQEAYKLRDAERIISFESPDFTWVTYSKNVRTKAHADKALRIEMNKIRKIHDVSVQIKKITVEANRVVILSRRFVDADVNWFHNTAHRTCMTQNSREVWVLYDGVWMLKRIEELEGELSFDP